MKINAAPGFEPVVKHLENITKRPRGQAQQIVSQALANATLDLGPDAEYGVMDAGMHDPIYVADSLMGRASDGEGFSETYASEEVKAMLLGNVSKGLRYRNRFNTATGRFDMEWDKQGKASDADILTAQLLGPQAVGWLPEIARKPLFQSNARKLVSIETGTNPWAEVINLAGEDFSGFAALAATGSVDANLSNDVETRSALMTQPVINASVTWKLSVAELERAKSNNGFPYAGQLIADKQRYAAFALDQITDNVIYKGGPGIQGLFDINALAEFNSGTSLTEIAANGADVHKGQTMYRALALAIADFMTSSFNMFKTIRVNMSPLAYNILAKENYSDVYNPVSAMKIFLDNFLSGEGLRGELPTIEFNTDPFLSASTGGVSNPFNTNAFDYMVITAPEVAGGPDDKPQSLLRFAMPLPEFVYPVIPGQYATPYKSLRRFAGVFAPYTPAVKVYYGFGI